VTQGFAVFDTAIGPAAIAWGPHGIVGSQLPEPNERDARAHMNRRFPDAAETAPPPVIRRAIDDIVALMKGEARDLLEAKLDMDGIPDFHRRVYEVARAIPPGQTLSYGEVAEKLGAPGAARAVGAALGQNRFPIIVPCHRVLGAGGKVGGFSARGGTTTKMRLLNIEGAKVNQAPALFDQLPLVAPPQRRKPRKHGA
jgi:methylated-DNA-[protein]-cysteine S-methyltransferase